MLQLATKTNAKARLENLRKRLQKTWKMPRKPAKTIDLRPDRNLLEPNFDGYKLSLEEIPKVLEDLEISVARSQLSQDQYSLLHATLYATHNHLIGESHLENDCIYFVNANKQVVKMYIDPFSGSIFERFIVLDIPVALATGIKEETKAGDVYNVSLCFASETAAVASDGSGFLHIIWTGNRSEENKWNILHSELVSESGFVVKDAVCVAEVEGKDRIVHCLLQSVQQVEKKLKQGEEKSEEGTSFHTQIDWLTFQEGKDGLWTTKSNRKLQGAGVLEYCFLERSCEALYLASDKSFKFVEDSENPVTSENGTTAKVDEAIKHNYTWTQTDEEVIITLHVDDFGNNFQKELLTIQTRDSKEITVTYDKETVITGTLTNEVTTFAASEDGLQITLKKLLANEPKWTHLLHSDPENFDTSVTQDVHRRLQHLCTDSDLNTQPLQEGAIFNPQQTEECDFSDLKSHIFQRLCGKTHDVTHSADLGPHKPLFNVCLTPLQAPALAVKHDVDACVWQPLRNGDNGFDLKHEGTLLAFAYVQASKQQRKFSDCARDFSYSVVCEASRHIFIYRQNKKVTGGELRHRGSGKRVASIAQQQVVTVGSEEEVLGVYAAPCNLYVLTTGSLFALKM